MNGERCRNLDLLRILSIYFVVCIHYIGWGGIANESNISLFNLGFSGGLAIGCNVAVNCFYMISGYFIKENESFITSKKRVLKIYSSTWCYSVILPIVAMLLAVISIDVKSIVFLFFPVLTNQYWFATCYIAMSALLPFLAMALNNLNGRKLNYLVCLLLILDCIQPILGFNAFNNIGYGLLHAMTMYVLGYWIKKQNITMKIRYSIMLYIFSVLLIIAIILISMKYTGDRSRTIADYNSLFMVLASFSIFMTFLNIRIKTKIFSCLSPYVFGVYLLNDNQHLRYFLWQKVFHCADYYNSAWLWLHCVVSTVIFTVIALLIEWMRHKIGEILYDKCGRHIVKVVQVFDNNFKKKIKTMIEYIF